LILVVSRFVMGIRVVLALAAGIAVYSAIRMFVYTLVSYLLFAGLLMYLGYKLVENLDRVDYYFTTYNYIVWPIVVAVVAVYLVRRPRPVRKGNAE
jgi:membrane protein DedA with SNARE-associated domain